MKKSDFTGWQEVFRFSFQQGVKQKAYKGFLIFMAIVMLLSMPVMAFIQNRGEDKDKSSEVTMLTVYDESGLSIDYSQALPDSRYAGVQITANPTGTFEEHTRALEESEGSTEILVHIVYEQAGYFNLTFVRAANTALKDEDCDTLSDDFESFFNEAKLRAVDVTGEQMAFISQAVNTRVQFALENGDIAPEKEKQESISQEEYFILLGVIMVVVLLVSSVGGSIATSIVTEKSTRVVEYLMINVRPMALIVGKILASLLMVLIQFGVIGICYPISKGISHALFGAAKGAGVETSSVLIKFVGLNAGNIIVAIVVIMLGVLFFSILAGLAGASVSKLEEMAEGLKVFQMLMMLGSYFGIFMAIMQMFGAANDILLNVGCLLPIAAPFVVPAYLLLGKVTLPMALISILLLVICTVLLFAFTARVYEALIFYNGKAMKLKDIIQIARNRRQSAGKEEKQA